MQRDVRHMVVYRVIVVENVINTIKQFPRNHFSFYGLLNLTGKNRITYEPKYTCHIYLQSTLIRLGSGIIILVGLLSAQIVFLNHVHP